MDLLELVTNAATSGTSNSSAAANDRPSSSLASIPAGITAHQQPLVLGLHRSDYMIDEGSASDSASKGGRLLQIELNTISSSFGCLSSRISEMHDWLARRLQDDPATPTAAAYFRSCADTVAAGASGAASMNAGIVSSDNATSSFTPVFTAGQPLVSQSRDGLSAGIAAAHAAYIASQREYTGNNKYSSSTSAASTAPAAAHDHQQHHGQQQHGRWYLPVVAFIVQAGERNIQDQKQLEDTLFNTHGIRSIRITLAQIGAAARVREDDGALVVPVRLPQHVQVDGKWLLQASTTAPSGAPADGAADEQPQQQQYYEISVAYYRSGYTPDDYPNLNPPINGRSDLEWAGRTIVECSRAVKCPSIAYHLAGTKKVQQELAGPGVLERFFNSGDADEMQQAALLRSCFAGLWSLDPADATASAAGDGDAGAVSALDGGGGTGAGSSGGAAAQASLNGSTSTTNSSTISHLSTAQAIADARMHPQRYVMKPQREGGGNNLYGGEIAAALSGAGNHDAATAAGTASQPPIDLAAYILMERIFPAISPSILVKQGVMSVGLPVVSELGVYGIFLGDGSTAAGAAAAGGQAGVNGGSSSVSSSSGVLVNAAAGHLLRTKGSGVDEGGVAAGFAVLDSPLLVC